MHLVRPARKGDLDQMIDLLADLQLTGYRGFASIPQEREDIILDLQMIPGWFEFAEVAERNGEVIGWVSAQIGHEMGRVWWLGPMVSLDEPWQEIADDLTAAATKKLPKNIEEQEWAVNAEHHELIEWARQRGAAVDPSSFVLMKNRAAFEVKRQTRPVVETDLERIVEIHDEMFPACHLPGHRLITELDEGRKIEVVEQDGQIVGYCSGHIYSDNSGYVEFLAVLEPFRRCGYGTALASALMNQLEDGGCEGLMLMIRSDYVEARHIFRKLGFTALRELQPIRLGFSRADL